MNAANPLSRLNYFNGLRLEATDLQTEQQYHIQVRRRLTAALFNPGIAEGLEVEVDPDNPHSIIIRRGVAIDDRGQEIILTEAVMMPVVGIPNPAEGVALGNYVAVAYGEERTAPSDLSVCAPEPDFLPQRSAPSRVVHAPRIVFLAGWPGVDSGYIVLARIALGEDCRVEEVLSDVRRYVSAAQPATTVPLSLEGEKDIDVANSKILHFHIEGGTPQRAVLYLRGEQFSSLYYSELGRHSHSFDVRTRNVTRDFTHTHTAGEGTTDAAGMHQHDYHVDDGESSGGFNMQDEQVVDRLNTDVSAIVESGEHTHNISDLVLDEQLSEWTHDHRVEGDTDDTGAGGDTARAGPRLRYFNNLRVFYDDTDITDLILAQLGGAWVTLGNGTATHALAQEGTGAIDLIRLGVPLAVGKHKFEFKLDGPDAGGGQVQYNLYVS